MRPKWGVSRPLGRRIGVPIQREESSLFASNERARELSADATSDQKFAEAETWEWRAYRGEVDVD